MSRAAFPVTVSALQDKLRAAEAIAAAARAYVAARKDWGFCVRAESYAEWTALVAAVGKDGA